MGNQQSLTPVTLTVEAVIPVSGLAGIWQNWTIGGSTLSNANNVTVTIGRISLLFYQPGIRFIHNATRSHYCSQEIQLHYRSYHSLR